MFHPLKGEVVTIKYSIQKAGAVVIIVYDRKGKIIKRILNGLKQPGFYSGTWDGQDENGVTAGNGIYIIYVKAGSVESKIKTGLIK